MVNLKSLSFKITVPKNKVKESPNKIIEKNKKGKVFIDTDGNFKVLVSIDNNPNMLKLSFTDKSYELKGKKYVFTRNLDKNGKRILYIRNKEKANYDYGDSSVYIPFAPNWIVLGNVIRENFILKFEFLELLNKEGYNILSKEDE